MTDKHVAAGAEIQRFFITGGRQYRYTKQDQEDLAAIVSEITSRLEAELSALKDNADFLRKSVGAVHMMISRDDLSELDGAWEAVDLPPRLKKYIAELRERGSGELRTRGEWAAWLFEVTGSQVATNKIWKIADALVALAAPQGAAPAQTVNDRVTIARGEMDTPHEVTVFIDGKEECCNMIPRHAERYAAGLRVEIAQGAAPERDEAEEAKRQMRERLVICDAGVGPHSYAVCSCTEGHANPRLAPPASQPAGIVEDAIADSLMREFQRRNATFHFDGCTMLTSLRQIAQVCIADRDAQWKKAIRDEINARLGFTVGWLDNFLEAIQSRLAAQSPDAKDGQ